MGAVISMRANRDRALREKYFSGLRLLRIRDSAGRRQ
jgi:hypothetical protein